MKVAMLLILSMISTGVMAQKQYISGIQKVTFRSGPGKTNKIIKMLESTTALTLLESGEQWSKVKDSSGTEGYVLNRFLTKDVPYVFRYNWLKVKYDKLMTKVETLTEKQKELKGSLSETQKALTSSEENLKTTNSSFEELKSGSAKYLELKQKFEKNQAALQAQNRKVLDLEKQISSNNVVWFVAGAGVLIVGWIIGLLSRKKKKYNQGLSF